MTRDDTKHFCNQFLDNLPDDLEADWRSLQQAFNDAFEDWASNQLEEINERMEDLQDVLDVQSDPDTEEEWRRLAETHRFLFHNTPA